MILVLSTCVFINYANYSFLISLGAIGRIIAAIRLPLLLLPWIGFVNASIEFRKGFRVFLRRNIDVVLLLIAFSPGAINSMNVLDFILYFFWFSACILTLLLFTYTIAYRQNQSTAFDNFTKVLLYSGFLAFLDLLRNFSGLADTKNVYTFFLVLLILSIVVRSVVKRYHGLPRQHYLLGILDSIWLKVPVIMCVLYLSVTSGRRSSFVILLFLISYSFLLQSVKSQMGRLAVLVACMTTAVTGFGSVTAILNTDDEQFQTLNRLSRIEIGGDRNEVVDESYAIRQRVWQGYLEVFREFPIVGVGIGNGTYHHERVVPKITLYGEGISGKGSHNTYLLILVESGVIGLFLFLVVAGRSIILFVTRSSGVFRYLFVLMILPAALICWTEQNLYPGQAYFFGLWMPLMFARIYTIR